MWGGACAAGLTAAALVFAWQAGAKDASVTLGRVAATQTETARVFEPIAASVGALRSTAPPWTAAAANQIETVEFGDPRRPSVRVVRGSAQNVAKSQGEGPPSQFGPMGSDDLLSLAVETRRGASENPAKPPDQAAADRVETVRFADPRLPAVRVVHAASRTPMPAPTLFNASTASTEIVSFGQGRAIRVAVVRGIGASPAFHSSPLAAAFARGQVETVRFFNPRLPQVYIVRGAGSRDPGRDAGRQAAIGLFGAASAGELDRVAFAVDGAESGHGANLAMWRPELDGPQGPMQVSAAAALDVGGGDRFDMRQNRLLGRAYLARLFARYGNWSDAIGAYNWGPGNFDGWIAAGRPIDMLPLETARYLSRVLRDAFLVRPL